MLLNTKSTPKSCGCRHCRRGKRTAGGKSSMRLDERAYRRAATLQLRRFTEDDDWPLPAPRGGYYD